MPPSKGRGGIDKGNPTTVHLHTLLQFLPQPYSGHEQGGRGQGFLNILKNEPLAT
jgi:hypothetical protein